MLKPGSNNHVHHLCPDLDISPKHAHAIQQEQLEANAVQQMQQMQFSVSTFMATEKCWNQQALQTVFQSPVSTENPTHLSLP